MYLASLMSMAYAISLRRQVLTGNYICPAQATPVDTGYFSNVHTSFTCQRPRPSPMAIKMRLAFHCILPQRKFNKRQTARNCLSDRFAKKKTNIYIYIHIN